MIATEFEGEYHDKSLEDFKTYEDYLNNFIDEKDRMYLEDMDIARQLIELGIHSKTQTLKKEQFEAKKKAIEEAKRNQNKDKTRKLTHKNAQTFYEHDEFLEALAQREDEVLNGKLMVIIFIRAIKKKPSLKKSKKKKRRKLHPDEYKYEKLARKYKEPDQENDDKDKKELANKRTYKIKVNDEATNKPKDEIVTVDLDIILEEDEESKEQGVEISGYIDFAHRLKTEDFTPYFKGEKLLLPKSTDLSYYNWNTGTCISNDSPNFKVDSSSEKQVLLFRNKRDRKVINVHHQSKSSDNTKRSTCKSLRKEYKQIVIFDHYTRRKT